MRLRLVAVLIAFATLGSAATHAEQAFTMADVNLRTGPDVEFPSVDVIPEGEAVYIEGCLRDESWCDVRWDEGRGWVFSEYLAVEDDEQMVPLLDVGLVEFRIPYVDFIAADYWGRYYVGRPWYRDRHRWFSYRISPRRGWHGPPSGARRPGWWRSGYHAPSGMRPPPDRGWRRTERHHRDRDATDRNWHDDRGRRGNDRGERGTNPGENDRARGEPRIDGGRERSDDHREGRGGRDDDRRDHGDRDQSNRGGERRDSERKDRGHDRGDAERRGERQGGGGSDRGADRRDNDHENERNRGGDDDRDNDRRGRP